MGDRVVCHSVGRRALKSVLTVLDVVRRVAKRARIKRELWIEMERRLASAPKAVVEWVNSASRRLGLAGSGGRDGGKGPGPGRAKVLVAGFLAALAGVAVGVALATGGGKGPSVQSLQCGPGQSLVVLQAGQNDNFNPNPDSPPATPDASLLAFITPPGWQLVSFDATAPNNALAHTFANLPAGITAAELELRAKPLFYAPSDFIYVNHFALQIGFGSSSPSLLPNAWQPSSYPSGHTFVLDLSALPHITGPKNVLPAMNAAAKLDVAVTNDSSVDYVLLRLCVGGGLTPIPVGTGLGGKATPTPTVRVINLTPVPVVTATPTPTVRVINLTPVPVVTATPTPAPTSTPTATRTSTPAPTSTPTPRLTPTPTTCVSGGGVVCPTPTP